MTAASGREVTIVRRTFGFLVALGLLTVSALPAQAAPPTRAKLAQSDGTPGLQHADKLHRTDPNRQLTIGVNLALRNEAQLEAFIAQVSNRKSPNYGRYLRPDQFAATYGPTQAQVQQVVGELTASGLSVGSVSPNRTIVEATGPVSAVEAAFGVTISDWHDRGQNRDFFGNNTEPTLPAAIASYVVGVAGLNNHYPLQRLGPAPRVAAGVGSGPAGGYTPNELKKAYDVAPLASAGFNGSGQPLGLFELDGFRQTNITTYDNQYGLGSPAPTKLLINGGPGPLGPGEIEVELDIEVMHAIAPASPITVWEGPNTDPGVNATYNAIVTSNTTKSNSTSWGICEPNTTTAEMTTLDNIFRQGVAQGQSFFAASGDYGAYDCGDNRLRVDSPASDPYITSTGGTALTLKSDGTYQSESAWSNLNTFPATGGGGGLSSYFSRPSWQTGPGVANTDTNGKRQVPDVSSDADPNTGYSVYVTNGGTGWTVVGGTSAAAPSWAAFTSVYNQYAGANGKPNLGFANPTLYSTASSAQPYPPFNDVTTGDNLHYPATTNWDYATGWGSYDANSLARDLAGVPWSASYSVANTPTRWSTGLTQTYTVSVTNAGNITWPSTGDTPVMLGVHFANAGGGQGNNTWYTDQRFSLPKDVAPGSTVGLSITVNPPSTTGSLVVEYQMTKNYQFWFPQYVDVNVSVGATVWQASYSVANTPTSWSTGQTHAYSVSMTNTGNVTWPSTGGTPVMLGVHFANTGGPGNIWYSDQRFSLPNDVAPGGTVTLLINVIAPTNTGNLVLEYQMTKNYQFWFAQYADINVSVVTSIWQARYSVANTPATWSTGLPQTYSVSVNNTGNVAWPSAGGTSVMLGVHFASAGGGQGNNAWLTDQRFTLPNDVAPGGTVSLVITVNPPSTTGNLVLEYQMTKNYQFWFAQYADINVSVGATIWQASYSVANTPTTWSTGLPQTYSVTVTNTGNVTWPSTGDTPVMLGIHFANTGGPGNAWYTDQRFSLPNDVAPGGTVSIVSTVNPPNTTGNPVLEYQMTKNYQFWFAQYADVNVSVGTSIWQASYSVANTPTSWSTGQTHAYSVSMTNTGNVTWPSTGGTPVMLGVHFANTGGPGNIWYSDQRFSLPNDVAPGGTVTLLINVIAPTNTGNLVLEYQMTKNYQFWLAQYADINVAVQ